MGQRKGRQNLPGSGRLMDPALVSVAITPSLRSRLPVMDLVLSFFIGQSYNSHI